MPNKNIILRDFEIETTTEEQPSEEELFQLLCDRIGWMIEYSMDNLMSLLYRNDILEHKIHFALSPFEKDPANVALAKLVMARQKERMETKEKYGKQDTSEIDEELKW